MTKYMGEDAWRVDQISNFADESFPECTLLSYLTKSQAERIAEILNETVHDTSRVWHVARDQDARLWRGMEEMV